MVHLHLCETKIIDKDYICEGISVSISGKTICGSGSIINDGTGSKALIITGNNNVVTGLKIESAESQSNQDAILSLNFSESSNYFATSGLDRKTIIYKFNE